jgi:YfiH family protein
MNPDWLQPDWTAPARVKALCTSRSGGASGGAYGSFNLGDHVGDAPAAVAANRAALARVVGVRPVFLSQVHGTQVQALDAASLDGQAADAAVSQQTGVACTIMVADCLPVLLTDLQGRRVAAAHAGWRGLVAGVLERTVEAMALPGTRLRAWLGPSISPAHFEVGEEVREAFLAAGDSASAFAPNPRGRWQCDLPALARARLERLGVTRIAGGDSCTAADPGRFFSHRRDQRTGRMAALLWRC